MKKEDFLEILRDYLKKGFSQDEIMDIVRDYEEYFIDGAIEGKSEMEIISGLGSPKEIANELLAESDAQKSNKIKSSVENVYLGFKRNVKKGLNKFEINLHDKNHATSRRRVKLLQVIVTILLIPIVIPIVCTTFGFGLGLIGSLVGAVIGAPFAISLMSVMPEVKTVIIFGIIAFVGFEILIWQLFIAIIKLESQAIKIYKRWIKTNQLYINGSIKKEEIDAIDGKTDIDGGMQDE